MFTFDKFHEIFHDALVEVLTSEMSVSIGGNDFENSIIDRQNRYVKCASTKIENQDVLFTFLVQTVSNGRRGWLIDNSSDV
mmetsp:Transcript_2922/g.10580  ORF Transcript_2922/g.10580 Transcript_2922/m.10580 type:complete len:81 (-) Transcript_2922:884-1126(-)